MGICQQRTVIITGAGGGLGRAYALAFAAEGANVVVNDIRKDAADAVVAEIVAAGGKAIANADDITRIDTAQQIVDAALAAYGEVHVVVNNAGILRDRMFANSSLDEWEATLRVHVLGHFLPARHAAAYWRDQSKAGETVSGRIINTSSGAGLMGSVAQSAYSAAKGAIASMTLVQAAELGRYGVTANAIAPAARTRMTEGAFADMMARPDDGFDAMDPANVAPLVAWLASPQSAHVTGRVFEVEGGKVTLAEGWSHGPTEDKGARWDPAEMGSMIDRLLAAGAQPTPVYGAS